MSDIPTQGNLSDFIPTTERYGRKSLDSVRKSIRENKQSLHRKKDKK
jgi:hypothetical protein